MQVNKKGELETSDQQHGHTADLQDEAEKRQRAHHMLMTLQVTIAQLEDVMSMIRSLQGRPTRGY